MGGGRCVWGYVVLGGVAHETLVLGGVCVYSLSRTPWNELVQLCMHPTMLEIDNKSLQS